MFNNARGKINGNGMREYSNILNRFFHGNQLLKLNPNNLFVLKININSRIAATNINENAAPKMPNKLMKT